MCCSIMQLCIAYLGSKQLLYLPVVYNQDTMSWNRGSSSSSWWDQPVMAGQKGSGKGIPQMAMISNGGTSMLNLVCLLYSYVDMTYVVLQGAIVVLIFMSLGCTMLRLLMANGPGQGSGLCKILLQPWLPSWQLHCIGSRSSTSRISSNSISGTSSC